MGKVTGFTGEDKKSYSAYVWNYQRISDRHCCTGAFFLRVDDFMQDVYVKPDLTLTEFFQTLGATWAFLGITIGLVARAGNSMSLDVAEHQSPLILFDGIHSPVFRQLYELG